MAGDISQFFGGIKSIQRGTISVTGALTQTATITSVDTTKTELRMLGQTITTSANEIGHITLTNATTITLTRGNTSNTTVISWELTEYF